MDGYDGELWTLVYCKIGVDQMKIVAPKRGIPAAGPELI